MWWLSSLHIYVKNIYNVGYISQGGAYCCMIHLNEWHVPLELKGIYSLSGETHLLSVNQRFGGTANCLLAGFLLNLFFRPWSWRRYVPPKRRLILKTTRHSIPEDCTLHNHRCGNLKSYKNITITRQMQTVKVHSNTKPISMFCTST
jgi:hypothetical protein